MLNKEEIIELEKKIDEYFINKLDRSMARNQFVFHCNLAYIDIVIFNKHIFQFTERNYLFALDTITFLAYKHLKEEDVFDYSFNKDIYAHAFEMIQEGMFYSFLCDCFPMFHSSKASIKIEGKNQYIIKKNELPRQNQKFLDEFFIRKALSYTLQKINGEMENLEDDKIILELCNQYSKFWSENLIYNDFEPYTRLDWGGVNFFLLQASMRRFNLLYKNNFDIEKLDSQKMMILFSPEGIKKMPNFIAQDNPETFEKILEECIYRPLGFGSYPKISNVDVPLHKTKDEYYFVNPLTILFSNSSDSRYLNFLRKTDNTRYMKVKEKIKERVIPLLIKMLNLKYPKSKVIYNFQVPIPEKINQKRECDLLVVSEKGDALYIEIKHFYYPNSYSESKILDSELKKALKKLPEQIYAISKNWEYLCNNYSIDIPLNSINGVIASHHYKGNDVEIKENMPIISHSELFQEIAQTDNILNLYKGLCETEEIMTRKSNFISKTINVPFANKNFLIDVDFLNPKFELLLSKEYINKIFKVTKVGEKNKFDNLDELAEKYLEVLK